MYLFYISLHAPIVHCKERYASVSPQYLKITNAYSYGCLHNVKIHTLFQKGRL